MDKKPFPPTETRGAMTSSLHGIDQSSSVPPPVKFTYVPFIHAKALDPENTIVEGIRGAGKSFWWAALNSEAHRKLLAGTVPSARINDKILTSQGFGTGVKAETAPSKDILAELIKIASPRLIWRTVIASQLNLPDPFPAKPDWAEKVKWVSQNTEKFERLLDAADEQIEGQGRLHLILFDALDRLADDWNGTRSLAKGLLQVALEFHAYRSIRLKLFLRPDMLEDAKILDFPDSSKLLARKVSLAWQRVDLYALLFQRLGNASVGGDVFRNHCNEHFGQRWEHDVANDVWVVPQMMRTDSDLQKAIFHAMAGDAMGAGPSGKKRGLPYTWLPNHLMDGREQVSPRSFCAALFQAAEGQTPQDWPYALHYKAIHEGVQKASEIRVNEIISEDYPWVGVIMKPLRGNVTVPCEPNAITDIWETQHTLKELDSITDQGGEKVKLPPQHLSDGPSGVLEDLIALGVLTLLRNSRIQIPDVYRVKFGLGRRGGVKPLK